MIIVAAVILTNASIDDDTHTYNKEEEEGRLEYRTGFR